MKNLGDYATLYAAMNILGQSGNIKLALEIAKVLIQHAPSKQSKPDEKSFDNEELVDYMQKYAIIDPDAFELTVKKCRMNAVKAPTVKAKKWWDFS